MRIERADLDEAVAQQILTGPQAAALWRLVQTRQPMAGADPGQYRGFFPWIRGGWFAMEAATVLTGLIALRKVRFPFLVAPNAFVLWFMSMDAAPALFHAQPWDVDIARRVSIVFGLVMS